VTNFRGWKGNVKAKTFIIAAGGIDNAKVLLNTEKDGKPAIGNRNDQVGRYFMEHPHITCAFITGTNNNEWAKDYIQHHVNEKTGKKNLLHFGFLLVLLTMPKENIK
jgi:choline dehydrogenase-like flavoprotein